MPNQKQVRTAIVVHVYHWDIWGGIAEKLSRLEGHYRLYITLDELTSADRISQIQRSFPHARIRLSPNKGMDILPFLQLIPELVEKEFQQVLKLHTKKGQTDFGQLWGEALVESFIGKPESVTEVESAFTNNLSLNLVGPAAFYLSGQKLMLKNQSFLIKLSQEIFGQILPDVDWGFFAGSMFWSRPQSWQSLALWAKKNQSFFNALYQEDGQSVHAIERFFGLACYIRNQCLGLLHSNENGASVSLQLVKSNKALINQATTRQLGVTLKELPKKKSLFSVANLLNKEAYSEFLSCKSLYSKSQRNIDLNVHYLMVGQFSGGLPCSKAWQLHSKNRSIRWKDLIEKKRVAGRVSIIIPVFNQLTLTCQCVESIVEYTKGVDYELLIINNGSDNETALGLMDLGGKYPQIRLIHLDENQNFALGSNLGFREASGEFSVFLNNDTQVTAGWLPPLVKRIKQKDVYAAQPLLLYPDGDVQCLGLVFSEKSNLSYPIYRGMLPLHCDAEKSRVFQAITAACMVIYSVLFAEMEGFDPIFINGQEDVDLCLRLKINTKKLAAYVPDSHIFHYESKTEGRGKFIDQNRKVFNKKWFSLVYKDEIDYYSKDGFVVDSYVHDRKDRSISAINVKLMKKSCLMTVFHKKFTMGEMDMLKEANKLFRNGQYDKALYLYKELRKNKTSNSSNVEFNILLCETRLKLAGVVSSDFSSKPLRVLFISNTSRKERPYLDPSVRYRCYNPAAALEKKGFTADVISFDVLNMQHVSLYDVFIFHRPPFDEKTISFMSAAKNNNKIVFADYDDLIFNKRYALHSSLYKSGRADEKTCLAIFSKNAKAVQLFDNFFVSTSPLKDKILEINSSANVTIAHNALGYDFLSALSVRKNNKPRYRDRKLVISYLSGTASHDKDFKVIEKPLKELLSKYKNKIEFQAVGPLNYDKKSLGDIKHFKYVEYSKLKKIISRSDLNVAPLEVSEFTNCKSGLKFFESGAFYVPSIVTPIADMTRFSDCDGISYALDEDDWYLSISRFVDDHGFYHKNSDLTGTYVHAKCTIDQVVNSYENAFEGFLK